jgi:hypothetical protein
MYKTNQIEKLNSSFINSVIAFTLSVPFYLVWGISINWKISVISIFFLYEIFFIFAKNKKRDVGMIILNHYWIYEPSNSRYIFYNLLYTLSFASLIFYIWVPLDLFFINILCIQLPMVLTKKTTLHGYLTQLSTIKNPPNRGFK